VTTLPQARNTGRFSYDVVTGQWEWGDEVFRIHGYQPGSVRPTTQLVLASKHFEDRQRVKDLLARVISFGGPFSIAYRIIGGDGVERHVVLVGEGALCEPEDVTTISGYYIDLTADFTVESEQHAQAAVEASAESRATIEQAKGVLMLAYGLESEQAFAMLRWWSRNRNIKIRDLATRLVELACAGQITDADLRGQTDALLHDVTGHM
jgi:hypothetical protein